MHEITSSSELHTLMEAYMERLRELSVPTRQVSWNWLPEFNYFLESEGIAVKVGPGDFDVYNEVVVERSARGLIANALLDTLWKPVSSASVFHYTKLAQAKSIVSDGGLRLGSLLKRIDESEIEQFQTDFYPLAENRVRPNAKEFAKHFYYASFSDTRVDNTHEDNDLWDEFASSGRGVRFTLRITTTTDRFRKMVYTGQIAAQFSQKLQRIRKFFFERCDGRDFHLLGSGLVACLYLPAAPYSSEHEFRIVMRSPLESDVTRCEDPRKAYVLQPFGACSPSGFKIDILDVVSNSAFDAGGIPVHPRL